MVLFSGVIGHRRFRPADVYPIVQLLVVDPRTHARTFCAPTINIYIYINLTDMDWLCRWYFIRFQYYLKTCLYLVVTAVNGGGNWNLNNNNNNITAASRFSSRALIANSNVIDKTIGLFVRSMAVNKQAEFIFF